MFPTWPLMTPRDADGGVILSNCRLMMVIKLPCEKFESGIRIKLRYKNVDLYFVLRPGH